MTGQLPDVLAGLGALLTAAGLAGILYLALASVAALRYARRPSPGEVAAHRPVTILKPLHGAEPGLFENLRSFCAQDYDAPIQIVFGVQDRRDAAIAVAEAIRDAFPQHRVDLVVEPRLHGTNRKVSNLVNMSGAIRHDIVVLADSDMRVGPDYLARITAELDRPGVGAVTCLYHGLPATGLVSRLSALAIDTHFLPGVLVGVTLGLAKPCFGSTIALRRATLDAVGGFGALANELADDFVLGERVRGLGLSLAIPPFTVGHVCAERDGRDLVRQEVRWQRTIRRVDPTGHAASILSHPVALALAGLLLAPSAPALAVLAAALVARLGICLAAERAFGLRPHPYWLVPLRDLLSFGIFAASFAGHGVTWRGFSYNVAPSGALVPTTEP